MCYDCEVVDVSATHGRVDERQPNKHAVLTEITTDGKFIWGESSSIYTLEIPCF